MTERVEFLAEQPRIHDNEMVMPWPDESKFEARALAELAKEFNKAKEDDSWLYANNLYREKGRYFRLRYRGQAAYWKSDWFGEDLADFPAVSERQLNQLLEQNLWAAAVDTALELYEKTQDTRYRTTAIFAGGLHAYDAVERSWPFIDRKLANDSGVRDKHLMGFLGRLHDVREICEELDDSNTDELVQKEYFLEGLRQFHMFFAEAGAQSPISFVSYFSFYDPLLSKLERGLFEKSQLADFTYMDEASKAKIVSRFCAAGQEAHLRQNSNDYFLAQLLGNFGIAALADCYDDNDIAVIKWWKLAPDQILNGDYESQRILQTYSEPTELYEQDSLF